MKMAFYLLRLRSHKLPFTEGELNILQRKFKVTFWGWIEQTCGLFVVTCIWQFRIKSISVKYTADINDTLCQGTIRLNKRIALHSAFILWINFTTDSVKNKAYLGFITYSNYQVKDEIGYIGFNMKNDFAKYHVHKITFNNGYIEDAFDIFHFNL